tara:strand:- start:1117 stop:1599 length:483 start_codon:yes stop_codon:yes gene_type:complete
MANFYSGQDGQLFVDGSGTPVAKVRSWSFTASQAVLETVSLEDTDRTIIPGIRSITGSCSIYYYSESGEDTGAGGVSTFLQKFVKTSGGSTAGVSKTTKASNVRLKLLIDDGSTAKRFIDFYAYITSLSMTNAVGQVLAADISFEVDGAPLGGAGTELFL